MTSRLRRPLVALLAAATMSAGLTLTTAVTADTALAAGDPTLLHYQVLTAAGSSLTSLASPSPVVSTMAHDYGTASAAIATSDGTRGFVDKGLRGGQGSDTTDSNIYPVDLVDDVIQPPAHVDCEGVTHLTISPDDARIAMYCTGDQKAILIDAGTYKTIGAYKPTGGLPAAKDLAFSLDGKTVWIGTTGGLYAMDGMSGTAKFSGGGAVVADGNRIGADLRVLSNTDVVTLRNAGPGSFDAVLEQFHFSGGSVGDTSVPLTAAATDTHFTVDPTGKQVWYRNSDRRIVAVDATTGADLRTIDTNLPAGPLSGLAFDATGERLIVALLTLGKATTEYADLDASDQATFYKLYDQDTGGRPVDEPAITTPPSPVASFGYQSGRNNTDIPFDASSSTADDYVAKYHWSWGDGQTDDTDRLTTHKYASGGTYTVTLTVQDAHTPDGQLGGSWDGRHWFYRNQRATVTRDVVIGTSTAIALTSAPSTAHVPYGSTITPTATFAPPEVYAANQSLPVHMYHDSTEIGGHTYTTADQGGKRVVTTAPVPVGDPGPHTLSAQTDDYNGNPGIILGAQSNTIDYIVDQVQSSLTASTPTTQLPAGSAVPVTATLSSGPGICDGGEYLFSVDGGTTLTHMPEPTATSDTQSITGLGVGFHTIKAVWTPYDFDTICLGSHSSAFTVSIGSIPTTTALTGPVTAQRAGAVSLSTSVATTSGDVPSSGTVTLTDGGAKVATAALAATGTNTFSVPLTYGSHTLTASYAFAGLSYAPSASGAVTVVVNDVPSAPAVTGTAPKPGKLQVQVAPADAHGSLVTTYAVTCTSPKGATGTASGAGPVVEVPGLRNNVDYTCVATATNGVGTSPVGAGHKGRPGALPKVTLFAPSTKVKKGTKVKLSGVVTAASQPQAGRTVTLTARLGKSHTRKVVGHTTTDSKGRFHFSIKVTGLTAFQASAPVGPATPANKELSIKLK